MGGSKYRPATNDKIVLRLCCSIQPYIEKTWVGLLLKTNQPLPLLTGAENLQSPVIFSKQKIHQLNIPYYVQNLVKYILTLSLQLEQSG